jgi:hypothetical protein
LKESTERGWLNDHAIQMSIDSPQFLERLDEARERKWKQGRYHDFEKRLARKFREDIDYQNGSTIKQIQFIGACTVDSIYGYKIVQETKLSFGRTWEEGLSGDLVFQVRHAKTGQLINKVFITYN